MGFGKHNGNLFVRSILDYLGLGSSLRRILGRNVLTLGDHTGVDSLLVVVRQIQLFHLHCQNVDAILLVIVPDAVHNLLSERFNLHHFSLFLQNQIVGFKLFSCIGGCDGHFPITALDDLILCHIGYRILRGIVDYGIDAVLRIVNGICQGLGKL